jgi:predicted MFS family arabinose efflux permease
MSTPLSIPSSGPAPVAVALAGTLLLAAAMGIGRFAYTPLLPPLRSALDWSLAQAGDVASANFLGYLLGALLASTCAQRPSRGIWLLAGMAGSALTTALGAVTDGFAAWLLLRLLAGVASAFCLVLGTATVVEYLVQRQRPGLVALHFAGVGSGIVLSVGLIETVRLTGGTVHGQWAALGIACVLLLGVSGWLLGRLPGLGNAAHDAAAATAPTNPAQRRALLRLVAAYGLFGFGYVVTATFIVAMARQLDHAATVEPLSWAVVGLLAAPSVWVWQQLARRIGVIHALRFAYAIEAGGVLLAGYGSGTAALLLGGALLGATFMGITALGLAAAREIAGRHPGRVIGWMTAAFGLGQLIGPAVAGRLAELSGGFALPSLLAAALLLVGLLLLKSAPGH